MSFDGFNRPVGTDPDANPNPAVNCRAIFKSPSGRSEFPARLYHIAASTSSIGTVAKVVA